MTTSGDKVRFLNTLAYVAVIAVGIALLLSYIFDGSNGGLPGALTLIANILSYIVVACYSFVYARSKNVWWVIAWMTAITLITVFTILPNFK
jgi:hypothetical protein